MNHGIPPARLVNPGFTRPVASLNAVPMLATATVKVAGVGAAYDAAKRCPVTWLEVENVPPESRVRVNPVRLTAEMGLVPTLPATKFNQQEVL